MISINEITVLAYIYTGTHEGIPSAGFTVNLIHLKAMPQIQLHKKTRNYFMWLFRLNVNQGSKL